MGELRRLNTMKAFNCNAREREDRVRGWGEMNEGEK